VSSIVVSLVPKGSLLYLIYIIDLLLRASKLQSRYVCWWWNITIIRCLYYYNIHL